MFERILFVCVGNICRSPMAEYWSRHQLQAQGETVQIASAGLGALKNAPIAPEVKLILDRFSIDTSEHRGKQINSTLVSDADIIFTMEAWQKRELSLAFPSARGKIFAFGKWREEDIADPYRKDQDVFEITFELIKAHWAIWQSKLWKN